MSNLQLRNNSHSDPSSSITGLAIAASLPKHYDITIVAKNLPGDEESQDWASPWAGAIWLGMLNSSEADQKIQLDALAFWWRLSQRYPESSVRRLQMVDIFDEGSPSKAWYCNKVPGFRLMDKDELPDGASFGVTYGSVIVTPKIFLPWMRNRLEGAGVKFLRANVTSLGDLKDMGHQILINATGNGAKHLSDVKDEKVVPVRGQTVLVKSPSNTAWVRRGKDYTYHLPRGDGTAILGGIKDFGSISRTVNEDQKKDILERIHKGLPQFFPSSEVGSFEVVRDLVGIRPQRDGGVRIEKEIVDGQKVVHAYGVEAGGYVCSWGLGKEVARLVNEFEFEKPTDELSIASKL